MAINREYRVALSGVFSKIDDTELRKRLEKPYEVKAVITADMTEKQKNNALDKQMLQANKDSLKIQKETNAEEKKKELQLKKNLAIVDKTTNAADAFLKKQDKYKDSPEKTAAIGYAKEIQSLAGSITSGMKPEEVTAITQRMSDLNVELKNTVGGLDRVRASSTSFTDKLKQSITTLFQYYLATQALHVALQQLSEGFQYVIELNKQMTDIQIVTGFSNEQVQGLTKDYNDLAKQLGATTIEVAKGSLEWFRQGKTIEETAKLTKASIVMSKLANMDSAQSTEYLTSIINGFKLNADEVVGVIDKLVAVDNNAATSVTELATAMQRSSNIAQQSGVSLEELVAYIGTVSSVTRRSADTIGEAFKTMFSRMADIQQGGLDDEGTAINNVEEAVNRIGIALRDEKNGFRDFSDVLKDVAYKWDTLNEVEQANLAKALAGTRQRETFLVLMQNYKKTANDTISVEKLLGVQTDSTGLAMERYGIYLDNVEAAQNRAKASWEQLWQTTVSSDFVKTFYNVSASLFDLIDSLGGLQTILIATATVLGGVYGTQILGFFGSVAVWAKNLIGLIPQMIAVFQGADVAIEGTTLAMLTNPVTLFIAAIAGLIVVIDALTVSSDEAKKNIEKMTESMKKSQDTISSLRRQATAVAELNSKYKELKEIRSKTSEQEREFVDVQNRLKDLMPQLNGEYDAYGNFIIDASQNMESLTQATLDQIAAEKQRQQLEINASAKGGAKNLEVLYNKMKMTQGGRYGGSGGGSVTISPLQMFETKQNYQKALEEEKSIFAQMGSEAQQSFIDSLKNADLKSVFEEYRRKFLEAQKDDKFAAPESTTGGSYFPGQGGTEEKYTNLTESLKTLSDEYNTLSGFVEKFNSGVLKIEDIGSMPKEYIQYLQMENGQLQINIDKLKEVQLQKARNMLADAEEANASQQEIDILSSYVSQLENEAARVHGAFNLTAWDYDNLIWELANETANATNYIFTDMQGNALSTAQSLYDYMSKSDENFQNIVAQYAKVLGISVADAMAQVSSYVDAAYVDGIAKMKSLQEVANSSGAYWSVPSGVQSTMPSSAQTARPSSIFSLPKVSTPTYAGIDKSAQSKADDAAKKREEAINKERQKAIDALKNQLNLYKDLIDARKKLLDTMAEERKYQKDLEERQESILKIQNELARLQLDNSDEAKARRLELADELKKAEEALADVQYEKSISDQKAALDAEYQSFEKSINAAIGMIQGIEATSTKQFASKLAAVLSGIKYPEFHTGAEKGVVGGGKSSGEVFAKLMAGEVVVNGKQIDNFLNKTLPSMAGRPTGESVFSGMKFDKMFDLVVQGNLDSSVIPDLERISNNIVERINSSLFARGIVRRTNLTRI